MNAFTKGVNGLSTHSKLVLFSVPCYNRLTEGGGGESPRVTNDQQITLANFKNSNAVCLFVCFFHPQLPRHKGQKVRICLYRLAVLCSFTLGKRQSLLRYMGVYIFPLSPLCLAYTDIYCRLHGLCARVLFLRCQRVSTATPCTFLLALLVT